MASDLDQLLDIVRGEVGPAGALVGPETRAADLRGWDSVAMVNILFAVEETFGVEFSSRQMERADGMPTLLRLLQEARELTLPGTHL